MFDELKKMAIASLAVMILAAACSLLDNGYSNVETDAQELDKLAQLDHSETNKQLDNLMAKMGKLLAIDRIGEKK